MLLKYLLQMIVQSSTFERVPSDLKMFSTFDKSVSDMHVGDRRTKNFLLTIITSITSFFAAAQTTLAMKEAGKHVGENLVVCGTILSMKHLENVKDKPVLINLAYAVEHLDVIISTNNTALAGLYADSLLYKDVCVTGTIYFFAGTNHTYLKAESIKINHPEIIASTAFKEPAQISTAAVLAATDNTNLKKKIELYKNKPDSQKKALLMKYMKMGHIVSFTETKEKKTYVILLNEHKKF